MIYIVFTPFIYSHRLFFCLCVRVWSGQGGLTRNEFRALEICIIFHFLIFMTHKGNLRILLLWGVRNSKLFLRGRRGAGWILTLWSQWVSRCWRSSAQCRFVNSLTNFKKNILSYHALTPPQPQQEQSSRPNPANLPFSFQVFLPRPPPGIKWVRLPAGWAAVRMHIPPPPAVQLFRAAVREKVCWLLNLNRHSWFSLLLQTVRILSWALQSCFQSWNHDKDWLHSLFLQLIFEAMQRWVMARRRTEQVSLLAHTVRPIIGLNAKE